MPVIKPILSFTLFLLLRRGVLFFIREKIYILKAPCSRNKHDFGRTFQKTVWRRPSGRQSCGASVAVQGRKRGRRCRLSSDKPRRNTRRSGEQAPFRAAELWRRRIFGAAGGFASFCGGKPRASSGKGGRAQTGDWRPAGDEKNAQVWSATEDMRCESPTAALSLALSIGDGGGRLCRSVKIWKTGERRGAARAGRDAERERARLSSDKPRRKRPRRGGMCAPEAKARRLRGWARLRGRFAVSGGEHAACVIQKAGTCAEGRGAACGRGEHGGSRERGGGPASRAEHAR